MGLEFAHALELPAKMVCVLHDDSEVCINILAHTDRGSDYICAVLSAIALTVLVRNRSAFRWALAGTLCLTIFPSFIFYELNLLILLLEQQLQGQCQRVGNS